MLTLGAARPTIAEAIGVCESSPRIPKILNLAVARLLPRGKWKGTYQRYRTCVSSGCITLSRHMETLEAFALCAVPGVIRNAFFEFQGTSYGVLREGDCPGNTAVDRGLACTFDDIGNSKTIKLKTFCDCDEAAGSYITYLGYDANNNWILTQLPDGSFIDGERVPLSTTAQISVNYFTKLVAVQKPITNCNVRTYAYDIPSMANVKALAIYEPDETLPQYRRYLIPGLGMSGTQSNCVDDCDQHQIDMLVKMAFLPVRRDTDYLIIGNLPALELACMAIQAEKNNQWEDANVLWEGQLVNVHGRPERRNGAIPLLEAELANFEGDGPVATPRIQDPALFGAGYIENFT